MEYFDYEAASVNGNTGESWGEIKAFLEQSEEQQKERLAKQLILIGRQLEERKEIREKTTEDIQRQIERCTSTLRQIYQGPFGGNSEERETVTDELADLYAELREVYRQYWDDRQTLEKERREIIQQMEELDDESLSSIL